MNFGTKSINTFETLAGSLKLFLFARWKILSIAIASVWAVPVLLAPSVLASFTSSRKPAYSKW